MYGTPESPPIDQSLTAHSRVPPNGLQHCKMRVPPHRGQSVHRPQGICATADHILSSAGNWDHSWKHRGAWLTDGQEEDNPTLHLVAAFLLYDGRHGANDVTFEMMQTEGVFLRLVELIQTDSVQEDATLHRMLLELMYESSRIQRLSWEDLSTSSIDALQP